MINFVAILSVFFGAKIFFCAAEKEDDVSMLQVALSNRAGHASTRRGAPEINALNADLDSMCENLANHAADCFQEYIQHDCITNVCADPSITHDLCMTSVQTTVSAHVDWHGSGACTGAATKADEQCQKYAVWLTSDPTRGGGFDWGGCKMDEGTRNSAFGPNPGRSGVECYSPGGHPFDAYGRRLPPCDLRKIHGLHYHHHCLHARDENYEKALAECKDGAAVWMADREANLCDPYAPNLLLELNNSDGALEKVVTGKSCARERLRC